MLKMYAELMRPERYFGFEPNLFNYLSAKNRCKDGEIFNVAVSNENGRNELNIYGTKSQHSLLQKTGTPARIQQEVQVLRLDTWAEKMAVTSFDFVKIDTQGFDLKVIQGMGELIRTVKIMIVELIFDDEYEGVPRPYEILEYLHEHGLDIYQFKTLYHNPMSRLTGADALFMNAETRRIICE